MDSIDKLSTMEFIDGNAIRRLRVARGWTLQDLADHLGMTRQGVDRIEKGKSNPSLKTLQGLLSILGITMDDILFTGESEVAISFQAYRKRQKVTVKTIEQIKSQVEIEIHRRHWLLQRLGELSHAAIPERSTSGPLDFYKVEKEAEYLRSKWDLGSDPVENIPEVLELRGVQVIPVQADDGFDGLCGRFNGNAFVVENESFPGDRQRYNLIHEFGHLFLNLDSTKEEEALVHRFAGAFLFPAIRIITELGEKRRHLTLRELELLKRKYGISMQSIIRRAYDLEIISDATYRSLNIQFRSKGYHKKEPGIMTEREVSTRLERLLVRGVSEGMLSLNEVNTKFPDISDIETNLALEEMEYRPADLVKMDAKKREAIIEKALNNTEKSDPADPFTELVDFVEEDPESKAR